MKIKELKICFENCEVMTIPREDIWWFSVEDIRENVNMFPQEDEVMEHLSAENIFIHLIKEGNKPYAPFGFDRDNLTTVFNRIKQYNDIVSVDICYEDGSHKEVYVTWVGDSKNENLAQHLWIDSQGDLSIEIRKDMEFTDN